MRSTKIIPGLLALLLGALPLTTSAQDVGAETRTPEVSTEARQLIERMNTFYTSLTAARLQVSMTFTDEMMPGGMTQTSRVAVGRPNLLRTVSADPGGGLDAACDGKELTIAMTPFQMFTTTTAPQDFSRLFSGNMEGDQDTPGGELAQDPPLMIALSLFTDKPARQMLDGVEKITLEGEEIFNGVEAHKLVLTTPPDPTDMFPNPIANAEVWIAKGEKPWLLGISPQFPEETEMTIKLTFEKWEEGAPEQGYSLDIPDTWTRVDDLMEAVMAKAAEQMEELGGMELPEDMPGEDSFHPTEGTPAPDFTLKTLDGSEEVTLSKLKGQVVVLDFWATWCAPCVAGLPTVDSVTRSFKNRGVVFYAVDLREQASRVSKFMEKKGWNFTVLMDERGDVAKAFGVGGIPHSVLIDREGVIRHVHIGFGGKEALEKQLNEELEGLVGADPTKD
ncbi:MAG: redoxin domain-containing protein [Planctomycetota bacterium]|nr:redoxin domain-containing protein [Planctomycetota bacterium]